MAKRAVEIAIEENEETALAYIVGQERLTLSRREESFKEIDRVTILEGGPVSESLIKDRR